MSSTVGRGDRLAHLLANSQGVSGEALRVALWFVLRGDRDDGSSFASTRRIAAELGVQKSTVTRAFELLRHHCLLVVTGNAPKGKSKVRQVCPAARAGEMRGSEPAPTHGRSAAPTTTDDGRDDAPTHGRSPAPTSDPDGRGTAPLRGRSAAPRVQRTGVHSLYGTVSTHEGDGRGPAPTAPKGKSSALSDPDPDRAAHERRIADETRAFLAHAGLAAIGDIPTRFAIEFGSGIDDWPDHTAVLKALLAHAKRESSISPLGLFRSWLKSRNTWAAVLCESPAPHRDGDAALGAKERHRRLRRANSVDVEAPIQFGEIYG